MVLRCVGGADRDVAELATGISPPDGSGTGGILGKDVALLIPSIEKSRCIPSQAEPALWSEDASYPQPRRVIHSYPQSIKYPRLSIPFGKRDGHMPARLKTKRKTRRSGSSLQETLKAESLHNNIVVTVSLSNARPT